MDHTTNTSDKLAAACLALYVGLVPLNCLTLAGMGSIYKFIVLGIAAVLILLTANRGYLKFDYGIAGWGLYIACIGAGVLWSENVAMSRGSFMGMLQIFAISFLFLQRRYTEKQHGYIKCAIVFSGIIFFWLQVMYGTQQTYTGRSVISFGDLGEIDPNEFCGYLLLPIAVCMQSFFNKTSVGKRTISIGFVALLLYCIMASGSRGGLLAVAVTIVVAIIKSGRFSAKKLASIIGLTILGAILFVYVIIPNMPDTLLDRFSLETMQSDGGGDRIRIWRKTLEMLWNNPLRLLFGCGVFGARSAPYCSHNMLIQVLLDSGIFGLLIYIGFIVQMIKRLKYQEPYVAAAFWGIQASLLTLSAYAWYKAVWIVYLLCFIRFDPPVKEKAEARGTVYEEKSAAV